MTDFSRHDTALTSPLLLAAATDRALRALLCGAPPLLPPISPSCCLPDYSTASLSPPGFTSILETSESLSNVHLSTSPKTHQQLWANHLGAAGPEHPLWAHPEGPVTTDEQLLSHSINSHSDSPHCHLSHSTRATRWDSQLGTHSVLTVVDNAAGQVPAQTHSTAL